MLGLKQEQNVTETDGYMTLYSSANLSCNGSTISGTYTSLNEKLNNLVTHPHWACTPALDYLVHFFFWISCYLYVFPQRMWNCFDHCDLEEVGGILITCCFSRYHGTVFSH